MSILLLFVLATTSLANAPLNKFDQSFIEAVPYVFALDQTNQSVEKPVAMSQEPFKAKNRGKAMFMSLLIPGLGQRYVESNAKATVFFGIEVGIR